MNEPLLIEDFAVELRGGMVEFVAGDGGERLAWFPAWEHAERDLRHFDADDIPIGPEDMPYEDADEGWRIRIFERGDFVYILEGDAPHAPLSRAFRIPRERYMEAWVELLDRFNPVEEI